MAKTLTTIGNFPDKNFAVWNKVLMNFRLVFRLIIREFQGILLGIKAKEPSFDASLHICELVFGSSLLSCQKKPECEDIILG